MKWNALFLFAEIFLLEVDKMHVCGENSWMVAEVDFCITGRK